MCTYRQLKNKNNNNICNLPKMAPLLFQNCTRLAEKISQMY